MSRRRSGASTTATTTTTTAAVAVAVGTTETGGSDSPPVRLTKRFRGSSSPFSSSSRERLPVFREAVAEEIIKAVEGADVTIITGDTGCGKSTGVPHLLLRHGLARNGILPNIVVTQPRRVAAKTVSRRVAEQIAQDPALAASQSPSLVGYRVRFEDTTTSFTRLKFVTDGLLVRECLMHPDPITHSSFSKYDYVIIDEAHERSLLIDQLLGLAKIAFKTTIAAKTFKLIVMSATLDTNAILAFFASSLPAAPSHGRPMSKNLKLSLTHIQGRTFPVQIFYTPQPQSDIIQAAVATVCGIILENTEGDILVFLPGAEEILAAAKLLQSELARFRAVTQAHIAIQRIIRSIESDEQVRETVKASDEQSFRKFALEHFNINDQVLSFQEQELLRKALLIYIGDDNESAESHGSMRLVTKSFSEKDLKGLDNFPKLHEARDTHWRLQNFLVLPLYASLPSTDQELVFKATPNARKIILATNIAETSLTLPNVRHVVDSGKVKLKYGNRLLMTDISMAMGWQRSGRAGRVAPGRAFRLMPETTFHQLSWQAPPEVVRTDLTTLLLNLRYLDGPDRKLTELLGASKDKALRLSEFPLPSRPPQNLIRQANDFLASLSIYKNRQKVLNAKGLQLARLPLPVRWANLLLQSIAVGCVSEVLSIVAMASLETLWLPQVLGSGGEEKRLELHSRSEDARKRILHPRSDHLSLLNLYTTWEMANDKEKYCKLLGVDGRSFVKAKLIREQLLDILKSSPEEFGSSLDPLSCSNEEAEKLVIECLIRGLSFDLGVRCDEDEDKESKQSGVKYTAYNSGEVFGIHPSSCFYLFGTPRPKYVIFSNLIDTSELFAREVTAINSLESVRHLYAQL